ncbi:MAG: polysaccharide biosynthesis tyrosine autokinase [Cyanobacteria bacterium J06634_6]
MKSNAVLPRMSDPVSLEASPEDMEGGLKFGQLLRTLQRKWWIIAGVTIATTAAAGARAFLDTPVYTSNLEILVQPLTAESEVVSNIPETLTSGQSPASSLDQDLLKILGSQNILLPVVEKVKAQYEEVCDVPLTTSIDDEAIVNELCYRIIASSLRLGTFGKDSDILRASYTDPDPQKVLAVLRTVSDVYLEYSLSSRQADINRGIEFVEQKLPDLRAKVDSLQNQLEVLRADNNLIDPGSRGNQLSSQMSTFAQTQLEISVELEQKRDIYDDLITQRQPEETNASSALAQNPRYQSLLNSLLDIDAQIAEASTIYLDSSPDMQVLREQRQNVLTLLAQQGRQSEQELLSDIRELESRQQAIAQTIQGLNSDVDQLSNISRRYTDIQRELGVATENLTQFLAKREALEIDAAQREIPWEVITPPTDPQPQRESLIQSLVLGGFLGLLLGAAAALLLDKSGGVIYSDVEIRRLTRLPVLGRIPYRDFVEASNENNRDVEVPTMTESLQFVGASIRADRNGSGKLSGTGIQRSSPAYESDPFSEAFRLLYTNIRLASYQESVRSITVSSTMPGEGKSTVALHLAEAAAAMGKRVLLVDADLRSPQLHHYLELSNEKGLTNFFSGESNPALIQKFLPEPNLYFIAAGSAVFEPTRLFSSRNMQLFAEKVKSEFDLIIFDTPPLVGQSDAYLVADHSDGMLLVTQPGRIKQNQLERAIEQLQVAGVDMLGMVIREGY